MAEPKLQLPPRPALRGYPTRYTNFMEQLQLSYVSAIMKLRSEGCAAIT
jgi:hypothetical protein